MQIIKLYKKEDLLKGIAVVNFPPKQIANFMSECLLGVVLEHKDVVLLQPERKAPNGYRIA